MSEKTTLQAGYSAQALSIEALTNMHVGSGKNNYGVIDNLVQRDVLTSLPTINSSSLKGALREYCSATWGKKDPRIRHIFGADTNDNELSQGGAYVFMHGQLMSIPVRSEARPYFMATCPMLISEFLGAAGNFGISFSAASALQEFSKTLKEDAVHFSTDYHGEATIEDLELKAGKAAFNELDSLKPILGENLVLLSDAKFKELTDDLNLPLIARNNLENGISKNLWYEQVLPRLTRFVAVVLHPKGDDSRAAEFFKHLSSSPVQIGANASIGYGFCHIKRIDR
jgi:CRISPR-associated protein Cmr4